MKNVRTKLVAFLLMLVMLVSSFAGTFTVFAAEEDWTGWFDYELWGGADTSIGVTQNTDETVGHRFKVTTPFSAVAMQVATWDNGGVVASIRFRVFEWNTNYKLTVEGTPIADKTFENLKDNAHNKIEFDEPLPAGEYLILASDAQTTRTNWLGKNQVLWYGNPKKNKTTKGCVYLSGVEQMGEMKTRFYFTEPVDDPFLQAETSANYDAYDASNNNVSGLQDWWRVGQANEIVGQRIKVTEELLGYCIKTPTWGNTNVEVEMVAYTWNKDYETTIAQGPFATTKLSKVADGQDCWLVFDKAMPAGEYLLGVRNPSEKGVVFAVYYYSENNKSLGYAYLDAAEHACDLLMTVRLAKATDTPFEKVIGYRDTTTGEVTVPEQWKPAEDSLLYTHKVQPSTWVFTDGLGRESWEYGENGVGAVNPEKEVGMFYWSWKLNSTNVDRGASPVIQEVMDKYPEAKNDYYHPAWNTSLSGWYWGVPIYGQYSGEDPWVLRRHAELLANAGVDFVFTDNSNTITTWQDGYYDMYVEWTKAQNDGVDVPKITYYLPMWLAAPNNGIDWWTTEQLESIYMDVYRQGQFQNLWYWFDGKPMMLGHPEVLDASIPFEKELLSFFTFRASVGSYIDNIIDGDPKTGLRTDEERIGSWGWSSIYPQATYHASKADVRRGKVEQMTVSTCSNFNYKTYGTDAMNGSHITGRSYTSTYKDRFFDEGYEASKWGYNMTEQFEYALTVDPKVISITGWNEWTVTRAQSWINTTNAFADQFDTEFSRDIEPSQGTLKDHYYYLTVNYLRKFKGAEKMPVPTKKASIDLSKGLEAQWEGVGPYFAAYIGNVMNRDYTNRIYYSQPDHSARNDVIGAQIARDDEYVYFNVECNDDITPYTDKLWMNLYIDVDQTNKGWETFDYVVNKTAASAKTSVLEKFTGEGFASEKVADVEYKVEGKFMTIKIAKSDLGISGDDYTINFAWTDNVHDASDRGAYTKNGWVYSDFSGDIMDFYTSGEVAPGARFKFSYISTAKNAAGLPEVDPETSTPAETTKPVEPTTTAPVTTPADTETSEPANTTTPADKETSTPAESTTAAPATTTAPSTTTAAPEVTTEADKGCGSVIALSAISVLTALGAAVVLKKKED